MKFWCLMFVWPVSERLLSHTAEPLKKNKKKCPRRPRPRATPQSKSPKAYAPSGDEPRSAGRVRCLAPCSVRSVWTARTRGSGPVPPASRPLRSGVEGTSPTNSRTPADCSRAPLCTTTFRR
ncbi:hypothetical protein T492DRAFT_19383 [Pavlovales sp. CCMP2436]|nr:hypothetical protein T492DRAFT_19383 [Pavlovales sp. CCMP2436]